jgi:hypothetical protein
MVVLHSTNSDNGISVGLYKFVDGSINILIGFERVGATKIGHNVEVIISFLQCVKQGGQRRRAICR